MKTPMETKITDEFASAMQQLSAEAEKILPDRAWDEGSGSGEQFSQILEEFRSLNGRMTTFEENVMGRLEKLESAGKDDLPEQFRKMDEHMLALRNTETVNQRLFDSLHEELIKYRDNFLHESLQKPFIRDLVILFDDLSGLLMQLETAIEGSDGKRGMLGQWRENLENAIHSLTEILHRMEVSEIEPREMVDRALHRVVSYEPADFAEEDGRIVMRVKRGFLWRDQVLRPEEVVAKRFS
jgi:molecular chaperone GrpE (heat shock protein)